MGTRHPDRGEPTARLDAARRAAQGGEPSRRLRRPDDTWAGGEITTTPRRPVALLLRCAVFAAVTSTACGAPSGQRPHFAGVPTTVADPCEGRAGPIDEPMTGNASEEFRDAAGEATWVLYAEVADVLVVDGGRQALTVTPLRVLKGPCDAVSLVVVREEVRNPVSRGRNAVMLLDGGSPPNVIGEPNRFPAGALNAAYATNVEGGPPEGL